MQCKYFVTGGAGFVGSHTVDALIAKGADVTVYDIKSWEEATDLHAYEKTVNYIEGDIRDAEALERAMTSHTHVLHLAAIVSVPRSIEEPIGTHATNVTGTLNVLEAARAVGAQRVAYASSAAVYGAQEIFPIAEDAALLPLSPYGLHKVINEQYAAQYREHYGLSTIGLRYFNIFGPRQDPSSPYSGVISIFVERMRNGSDVTVFGDGSATRDFVYVSNIVDANIRALHGACTGVCNVGTGKETSIRQLITALDTIFGTHTSPVYKDSREGDIARSVASIARAGEELGYTVSTDLKKGLETYIRSL